MEDALRLTSLQRIIGGIIEAIPDAVTVTDGRGVIVFTNASAERILGLPRSEIIGRAYNDVRWKIMSLDGETLPKEKYPFFEVMERKEPLYGIVYSVEKPDGTRVIVSANAAPLKEHGVIIGVVASFTDITERKKSEKVIQDALVYAESIVKTVREPLIILDERLRVRTANPAFYRTFKVSKEETEEKLIYDLGNRQWDIPKLRELLEEMIPKSTQIDDFEVEHTFPSIGYKVMLLNARKIYQEEREALILLAIEDITERKRVERDLLESKRLSDALNYINAAITSTFDFREMMQRTLTKAAEAIGCETAAISLRKGGHWVVSYAYGFSPEIIGTQMVDEEEPHAVLAIRTKQPVVINDAYSDERVNREHMKEYGVRSVMVVPITTKAEVVGVIFFNYLSAPIAFTATQIDFANKLAASISLALENAHLYELQRNIADTLQTALLTVPEHIEGVEYGYLYRSATEATRVGGDFFDIFELEHDRVGIVVGDVAGKGLGAATITALVRNTIRAYAYEEKAPAKVMAMVNDTVIKTSPPGSFVTVFFGIVDMKSGHLTYCSAGHPPAMIKRASEVKLLEVHSPIIGAFKGLKFKEAEAILKEGDILVLYTDGVTEARCDGGFFGEARLIDTLKSLKPLLVKDVPQAIFDKTMIYSKGIISDDIVLLSLSLGMR